jgi:hypothetical protein
MDDSDFPLFLAALNELSVLCCDELTQVRQRLYWQFLRDNMCLEEWQYACEQVMLREIYHKVPMPAVLIEYAREFRKRKREQRPTVSPPLQLREDLVGQEQVKALLASVWPNDRLKDPPPPYETEAP